MKWQNIVALIGKKLCLVDHVKSTGNCMNNVIVIAYICKSNEGAEFNGT